MHLTRYLLHASSKGSKFKLPLKHFIRQQQIITLYRQFLKATNKLEDESLKQDIRQQIRSEFRQDIPSVGNPTEMSSYVSTLLVNGKRELERLRSLAPADGASDTSSSIDLSSNNSRLFKGDHVSVEESWLNIEDEEDKRGRVGKGWPWSSQ